MAAWCHVNGDATRGNNQRKTSMWARIWQMYEQTRAENPEEIGPQNENQMKGRYKRLNENANKWVAAYRAAHNRMKSGMRKHKLFAQHQEAVRKDVERAFGVLQARFAFLRHPCLIWDYEQMGKIIIACIIMYNMIVEDERETYINYDPCDFFNDTHINGNDDVVEYSSERIADLRSYMRNRE